MIYIQKVDGDRYERIVLDQQEYSSQSIPYRRGDIVDCKNTILATSKDVYNVVLDCRVLNAKKACIEPTIAALTSCFGIPESDIRLDCTCEGYTLSGPVIQLRLEDLSTHRDTFIARWQP